MATKTIQKPNAPKMPPRAPAKPWGQKILREKAVELLREGSAPPSAIFANVLIASMSPTLDVELLLAKPRAMSEEANRIIASALQKFRAPNADVELVLDGLMALAWTPKSSHPAPHASAAKGEGRHPSARSNAGNGGGARSPERKKAGTSPGKGAVAAKAPAAAPSAPVIVRKPARGPLGE